LRASSTIVIGEVARRRDQLGLVLGVVLAISSHGGGAYSNSQLMIRADATLPELQARLGHESLATTGIDARALSSDENPHADKIAAMPGIE